jgi:hypothetical protein
MELQRMKTTTKQTAEESGEAALTRMALDMISKGETRRELAGYSVSLRLEVEPRFVGKKEGGR